MKKIKKGDLLTLNGNEKKNLYFTGIFDCFEWQGKKCVFLAEDLENTKTYSRFSQQFLEINGYCI